MFAVGGVIGPRREKCEYAIAVAYGVVRGIFRVNAWQPREEGDSPRQRAGKTLRWGFDRQPAAEMQHLVGLDVSSLFVKGAANPVLYLNC